jgi:HD-like signal output (HDOD) protein
MSAPSIADLISNIPRGLGSYAPVMKEVEEALRSPQCSLYTLAQSIEKDPDLTARLLRLGNSLFYGFSSRLATVTEAISLIGIQQVQDLILASSIIERFNGVSHECVSMESFWRHSLACGIGARRIAIERRLPRTDKYFVAGLLHDVGRLVLLSQAPKYALEVFELYRSGRMLLREAEAKVLGYDHQQIAGLLLQHWKYPPHLVIAVSFHHQPTLTEMGRDEVSVVHISDYLVNAMQIGSSGERHVPPLDMKAWDGLRLPPDVLPRVMAAIDEQFDALHEVFLSGTTEGKPR